MKKRGTYVFGFCSIAILLMVLCLFFSPVQVGASTKKIPENGEAVKVGDYYLKWSRKDWTYPDGSYNNIVYRSKTANGKKIKLVSTSKRIQFVITDGKHIYFDTGEETYVDPEGHMFVGPQQKKIKIWKMSVATGKKKVLAVVAAKDKYEKKKTYDEKWTTVKGDAQNVLFCRTYGRFVYFFPEVDYHGERSHSVSDGTLVCVNLKNGTTKIINLGGGVCYMKDGTSRYHGYGNSRFECWGEYKNKKIKGLICLDLQKGTIKTITTKIVQDWSLKDHYLYFFEELSNGSIRVARYDVITNYKNYVTKDISHIKPGTNARALPTYTQYYEGWPNSKYFRYYYKSKKLVKANEWTYTVS